MPDLVNSGPNAGFLPLCKTELKISIFIILSCYLDQAKSVGTPNMFVGQIVGPPDEKLKCPTSCFISCAVGHVN